jgi:hypothetical protein
MLNEKQSIKRVIILKSEYGDTVSEQPVQEDNHPIARSLPDAYFYRGTLYIFKHYFILHGCLYLNYEEASCQTLQ